MEKLESVEVGKRYRLKYWRFSTFSVLITRVEDNTVWYAYSNMEMNKSTIKEFSRIYRLATKLESKLYEE